MTKPTEALVNLLIVTSDALKNAFTASSMGIEIEATPHTWRLLRAASFNGDLFTEPAHVTCFRRISRQSFEEFSLLTNYRTQRSHERRKGR
jgi:hypothetical protein